MIQKPKYLIFLIGIIFLFVVLILDLFFFQKTDEENSFKTLQEQIREEDSKFDSDFEEVISLLKKKGDVEFGDLESIGNHHPFFLVDSTKKLIYWSDFSFSLDFLKVNLKTPYQYLNDPFGSMLLRIRKIEVSERELYLIQALRLVHPGNISNDYLITGPNPDFFGNENFDLFEIPKNGDFQVRNNEGIPLFGISFRFGYLPVESFSSPAVLIFFISIFLLYFLLSSDFVLKKWRKGKRWTAILFSSFFLILFRILMLLVDFPSNYINLDLFDSVNYASSWYNPSLGDLLINTFCLVLIILFFIFHLLSDYMRQVILTIKHPVIIHLFFILLLIISSLSLYGFWSLPKDLVLNSQWGLDISSISKFDLNKGISFLILFLWGGIYVLVTLTLIKLLWLIEKRKGFYYRLIFIFGGFILLILFFYNYWIAIIWLLHVLFLFVVIKFELIRTIYLLGLETFLTFFFTCLITATVAGISTFQTENEQFIQSKKRFSTQNLIEKDVMTEFFLGEIFNRIQGDLFIQNRIEDPFLSKELIETKIRKIYLTNYFDQFDVQIQVFSLNGNQLHGAVDGAGLEQLKLKYMKSDYATGIKDLYFIQGDETYSGNRFISFLPVLKNNSALGIIFLEFNQMRVQPSSVYPKLLLDKKYIEKLDPVRYDFSIFRNGELIKSSGTFNYSVSEISKKLDDSDLFTTGVNTDGYHHLGVMNGEELIVVSSPMISKAHFFGTISLFFVVFVFFTFLTILFIIIQMGARKIDFNYSTKLQLYLNFAFFFPIVIISVITVGLLASSYRQDLDRQYIQKASLIKSNLVSFLSNSSNKQVEIDQLNEEINRLANTIASDIHFYKMDGQLEASNRLNIFEKKILSTWINPLVLAEMGEKNRSQFLAEERVGKLNYKSVYLTIPSQNNQGNLGILAVPFFESESELNILISDVLSNIFNTFVVIFILFLAVSYFVSKNLTYPFRLLTQKLKTTNLENNEPMIWSSKDEIGMLINEYNNMLFKLETSKKVLASTEKESAWREMAKQVAHEIKNPLTPMKLTLQHLLRLESEGKLDDHAKLRKSIETIIHQVDALSGIASSFSTFAKMPLPRNEAMDFKIILNQVLELFKNDQQMDLVFRDDSYSNEIYILGDDQLFGRVISNLIINGIQSVDPSQRPVINIWLWKTELAVFLEIGDNGKGIPSELKDKIFLPNFSTKSQGSGLGLAIAKSGVETAGGKIWFESEVGKGTTFFLSFPIV